MNVQIMIEQTLTPCGSLDTRYYPQRKGWFRWHYFYKDACGFKSHERIGFHNLKDAMEYLKKYKGMGNRTCTKATCNNEELKKNKETTLC